MPDKTIDLEVHGELAAYHDDHESLEVFSTRRVDLEGPLLLRLDGRSFHTVTRDMRKPFDEGFERAMDEACRFLLGEAEVGATFAYCQSDEITVVVDPERCPFGARHEKLVSVVAGASSGFLSIQLAQPVALDCRAIPTRSRGQALGVLAERQNDCAKNAVSQLLHWTLVLSHDKTPRQAHRILLPLSIQERRSMCSDLGVPADGLGEGRLKGRICRYEVVPHVGVDPRDGREVQTTRRRLRVDPAPDFRRLSKATARVLW